MQAATSPPPAPPADPQVNTDIKPVQLDGNIKLFQCYCNSHLRYEAEYGRKRGTTTNAYLITDGDDAMLIDVPRKAYLETFCEPLKTAELNLICQDVCCRIDHHERVLFQEDHADTTGKHIACFNVNILNCVPS